MEIYLEFEKPIAELEKKIRDLRKLAQDQGIDFSDEVKVLEKKVNELIETTMAKLTPWQRVQLARHPGRPYTSDYLDMLFPDFMEIHGDRAFGDDQALVAGVASWPPEMPIAGADGNPELSPKQLKTSMHGRTPILIIGHQKGRTTKQKMERNFAMARPEGYRKAIRLFEMAERTRMPILTFIDTPGAYPGLDAEERGQSQAIAEGIRSMFKLTVPVVCVVIGEGGSGGALAVGIGNKVLMQQFSYYSVISPESCASILWSDSSLAEMAADRLKMNSDTLFKMGLIDGIIPEPKGGAHRDMVEAGRLLREALVAEFDGLMKKNPKKLQEERTEKFRKMGSFAFIQTELESEK